MGKRKIRADQLLLQNGQVQSREEAKRLIMAGKVRAPTGPGGQWEKVLKPGSQLPLELELEVLQGQRFASRGGQKLQSALEHFRLDVQGMVALDVGASSGGFTDCLLQHGASRVYALDVGYGQLDWKLRSDPRVYSLERVNIRYAEAGLLPEPVDLLVVDCSFISLRQVLPASLQFLRPGGLALSLVKPQFELGRGRTEKGVVRIPALQEEAVHQVWLFAGQELGLECKGQVRAGLKGPKGNQEYFVLCRKPG
ncbi:MAG: TlyA family RNA methyltransferase [Desulfohalobiaceae bacterium]